MHMARDERAKKNSLNGPIIADNSKLGSGTIRGGNETCSVNHHLSGASYGVLTNGFSRKCQRARLSSYAGYTPYPRPRALSCCIAVRRVIAPVPSISPSPLYATYASSNQSFLDNRNASRANFVNTVFDLDMQDRDGVVTLRCP